MPYNKFTFNYPLDQRIGQSVVNFLTWCKKEKKLDSFYPDTNRLVDPFYWTDARWHELWNEWLESLKK